jgi:diguanylate cyclase (GGDEF)-like protein
MGTSWLIFALILIVNALAALVLAFFVSVKRYAPGSKAGVKMFLALAVWTFAYALITLVPGLDAKLLWLKIENIGIVSTPVFWFFFAVDYTQNDKWFPTWVRALFWLVPLTTLVFLFSGRWFDLYYASALPFSDTGGPLVITRGFWYPVQMVYTYGLIVLGFVLLFQHLLRLRDLYRRQIVFVLAGIIIPLVVNLFYQNGARLFPALYFPVDLTPVSFTITAALISVGVFGLRLFDLIPIARSVVIDNIPELVIVVDAYNRILDVNSAAQGWLQKPAKAILGQDLMSVFNLWSGLGSSVMNENNVLQEIEIPGAKARTLELMVSPIKDNLGNLEGRVIVARDISGRKNLENELKQTIQTLKAQMAEVESLRAKLYSQAAHDPLTGLYNRRYLAEALDREIMRAQKETGTFCVIVIGLDHFKSINDHYGHKCGDVVLLAIAQQLSKQMRAEDVLCRYGGAEFVVLAPDMPLEASLEKINALRTLLEGKTLEYNGQTVPFATFSAGVASYPEHGSDGDRLLSAADQALYQSKANGRNLATVYSGEKI